MLTAVIMAGGYGKRLWPLSRIDKPKQCLSLVSNKSLLEDAIDRMEWVTDKENIIIVTTQDLENCSKTIAPEMNYLVEPIGKGTAASIGLAVMAQEGNPTMVIGTADHAITEPDIFAESVRQASALAESNKIILFGIPITRSETGYGYIKRGQQLPTRLIQTYLVDSFKEKPTQNIAQEYMKSGDYFWNSGMFIAKKEILEDGIKSHLPKLWEALIKIKKSNFNSNIMYETFKELNNISIDIGVIEKSSNVAVLKANFQWDDVGDFLAFSRIYSKDIHDNVIHAKYQGNAENSIIFGRDRIIYTSNVSNIVIIDSGDAVLVCARDKTQDVAKLLGQLDNSQFKQYTINYCNDRTNEYFEYDGKNKIRTDTFVATVGVSDFDILVNSQSIIVQKK